MAWIQPIQTLESQLDVQIEVVILLVVLFSTLIFYAKDFKIGVIMSFIGSILCFMLFYTFDVNYVPALITSGLFFVILCLTLYAVNKQAQVGGIT